MWNTALLQRISDRFTVCFELTDSYLSQVNMNYLRTPVASFCCVSGVVAAWTVTASVICCCPRYPLSGRQVGPSIVLMQEAWFLCSKFFKHLQTHLWTYTHVTLFYVSAPKQPNRAYFIRTTPVYNKVNKFTLLVSYSHQDESSSHLTPFMMRILCFLEFWTRAASIRSLLVNCHHPDDQSAEARGH